MGSPRAICCPACRTCRNARPASCPRPARQHEPPAAVLSPRRARGRDLLPEKIVAFVALQREPLNAAFGACLQRAPAVSTLRRLFLALGRDDLEAAFQNNDGELPSKGQFIR